MLRFPQQTLVVDLLAPAFTALKWTFLGASFVLLVSGIVVGSWRWLTQRARARGSGSSKEER
jgi:hypothetical protein